MWTAIEREREGGDIVNDICFSLYFASLHPQLGWCINRWPGKKWKVKTHSLSFYRESTNGNTCMHRLRLQRMHLLESRNKQLNTFYVLFFQISPPLSLSAVRIDESIYYFIYQLFSYRHSSVIMVTHFCAMLSTISPFPTKCVPLSNFSSSSSSSSSFISSSCLTPVAELVKRSRVQVTSYEANVTCSAHCALVSPCFRVHGKHMHSLVCVSISSPDYLSLG